MNKQDIVELTLLGLFVISLLVALVMSLTNL